MWPLVVPICLAILGSSLSLASEPHFVITVPTNLPQGTEEKACVAFLDLKGPVDLKLELKKDDEVHILAEHKIDAHDHSECYPFKVPIVKELTSYWLLHVTAHGDGFNWDKSEKVVLTKHEICLIQTDKSVYKPGDIVKIRLVSMDHHFHVFRETHPLVELTDTNNHRIAQWLNVSADHGFADLSFHLANELPLGSYNIKASSLCETTFKVEKYVLKRFAVNIKTPSNVALIDKSFHLEVCGRYNYGKPVEGSFDISICKADYFRGRLSSSDISSEEDEDKDSCQFINKVKADSKGCVSKDIDLESFKLSKEEQRPQILGIRASLTEDQTGRTEKESDEVKIKMHKSIEFLEILHTYRKGIPYRAEVKLTDEKEQPVPNRSIYLYVGQSYFQRPEKPIEKLTDENGIAHFTLNTSTWDFMTLRASLLPMEDEDEDNDDRYVQDHVMILQFYSLSESHISIKGQSDKLECDSDETLTVEYDIQGSVLDSDTDHLHFFSFLRTTSGISLYKDHKIDIKDQSKNPTVHGSFPVSFHMDQNVFPWLILVVFTVLPNGETIASLALYEETPFCTNKKVQLKFSEEQVHPGESVNLEVTANAGSVCSVRSVDKGLQQESVLPSFQKNVLQSTQSIRRLMRLDETERHQCPENQTAEVESTFPVIDVNTLFKSIGLRIFTNTHIKRPVKCVPSALAARSGSKVKKPGDKERDHFTRRHFPDSWLFELVSVGSEGHTVLNRTTPDSITTWVTDAFCLDKTGISMVTDVELITFQPYFIDLIVPYSVVQGETFTIQAVVFNYVKKCILIVVALKDSEEFATVKNREQARCVCEGNSHSFTWDLTAVKPKTLQIHVDSGSLEVEGECTEDPILITNEHRKDSVEKTVVVKPRGHEEEKTQTFLLFSPENKEVSITLALPERLVAGSERAHIIVLGDLMANIAVNLDSLVHLPDGCGEQNLAKFSRYVSTLDYLEGIQELTPEKKAKAIESLVEGYQKQLTFRSENGSFGFFPDSPNLWVTAFVVKTFTSARHWIYINEKDIQEAVEWLQSLQLPDGCFRQEGNPFNNALNEDNEVTRTAYVIISLLEHPKAYSGSIVENALSCLRKSVDSDTSVYTQALMAYAFTLSGDSELRDQILKKLDESAKKEDGLKYWENGSEIETESYILLALLSDKAKKHLEESADIVRWIVSQQNPNGGFQSSQDTTIALQALAEYAKATQSKKGDSTVTIRSKSGFEKTVHLDKSNSLLIQTVDLPEIPGEYTVIVTGDGFVYLQLHVHYNTLPEKSETGYFSLNVVTEPTTCDQESQKTFNIQVDVKYSGKRESTNMAVILIEPISGYIPNKRSLSKLKNNLKVKRTEVSPGRISIYMDNITHELTRLVLSLEQETNVDNLQPATISVYDYYYPEEHTVVEYNAPCTA